MSHQARKTAAVALAAVTIQLIMVIAFTWPAARTEPREVPLVVAGAQAEAAAGRLAQERPGAFEVTRVADEQAARQALADREAYGAIVSTPAGPRMIVASAASTVVAQQLTQLGAQLAAGAASTNVQPGQGAGQSTEAGQPTQGAGVQDVVPAGTHGTAFGSLVLPLVMSSIAAAVLMTLLISAIGWRLVGLSVFAVLGGLAVAGLAQGWLDILPGSYLAVSGVAALAILAISGVVTGTAALLGTPGIGVGALIMLLLGNPLSAATSAPELLPEPWGALGQLLPPGAAVSAVRSVAYFDGAGAGGPLAVLLAWAAGALALLVVGALRGRGKPAPAPARAEPALIG